MVKVMEKLVELVSLLEPGRLGYLLVVGRVEGAAEATEHAGNGQLELRVAVKGGGVKYDGAIRTLCHVAPP